MTPTTTLPEAVREGTGTPGERITFEDFLNLPGEEPSEWVDGKVVPMPGPSILHQRIVGFIFALLQNFLELRPLGSVFCPPTQLKGPGDGPGRQPDVMFLSREHGDRLHRLYVQGPADLVVEVVSPESQARDRGEKFSEYEAMGTREYWLIDPLRREASLYALDEENVFQLIRPDADGRVHSAAIEGLWIDPEWLWLDPPPSTLGILKAWGMI